MIASSAWSAIPSSICSSRDDGWPRRGPRWTTTAALLAARSPTAVIANVVPAGAASRQPASWGASSTRPGHAARVESRLQRALRRQPRRLQPLHLSQACSRPASLAPARRRRAAIPRCRRPRPDGRRPAPPARGCLSMLVCCARAAPRSISASAVSAASRVRVTSRALSQAAAASAAITSSSRSCSSPNCRSPSFDSTIAPIGPDSASIGATSIDSSSGSVPGMSHRVGHGVGIVDPAPPALGECRCR